MPGLITSISGMRQSAAAGSTSNSGATDPRAFSLSSHAHTVAPLADKAAIVAAPVRPRPRTATILPSMPGMRSDAVTVALRSLSQFQGGKADQRQHRGDDPEAD